MKHLALFLAAGFILWSTTLTAAAVVSLITGLDAYKLWVVITMAGFLYLGATRLANYLDRAS